MKAKESGRHTSVDVNENGHKIRHNTTCETHSISKMNGKPTRPAPVIAPKKNKKKKTEPTVEVTIPQSTELEEAIQQIVEPPPPNPSSSTFLNAMQRVDKLERVFEGEVKEENELEKALWKARLAKIFEGEVEHEEIAVLENETLQKEPEKVEIEVVQEAEQPGMTEADVHTVLYEYCPFHVSTLLQPVDHHPSPERMSFCPEKSCPVFTSESNKQPVIQALMMDTHPEIRSQWGMLFSHCGLVPKMRLSKTIRNLHKVFLTCGERDKDKWCKYFQWIHTPVFRPRARPPPHWLPEYPPSDPRFVPTTKHTYKPRPPKTISPEHESFYRKDSYISNRIMTEKDWFNQFPESAQQQELERKQRQKQFRLPSEFYWSPEIEEYYKKNPKPAPNWIPECLNF